MSGIIIPKKTILELRKVLDDAESDINISLNENKIKFSFSRLKIVSGIQMEHSQIIQSDSE